MLAPVYIYYGFESAGDISEETKDAGRQVPRAMRLALIWGGIASFVLTAALLLAMPAGTDAVAATVKGGGVPFILGQLPTGVQDFLLLLIIFAFFSCGTSVQGAGSRLAFSYAATARCPGRRGSRAVNQRFRTPVNALLGGARGHGAVRRCWSFASPTHDVKHLVHHLPGQHQRAGLAGVVRRQRHLPVVPADGDRVDDRPGPRLGAGGQVHARPLGLAGLRRRRRSTWG